ncbi:3-deoxy-manno-octulosonate cytidylyltransferase [uncultured Paludibaculum sp.]|uniref:3-deoxy-manno-octulosonate cytidylyltransferase n=1 Tax=uncultured Paludibaculum sp. TaxID=1765020 RepID=UPI00374D77C0
MPPKILGVIPARFASVRFPGKPIATLAGKPMIQHVWERALLAKLPRSIVIATDDDRIASVARSFGAEVVITRQDHLSGTDRVAEAASTTDADIVVNIQGDEPLIDPDAIDAAITVLLDDPACQMATLKKRIVGRDEIDNPNVVKVVTGHDGRALYFSRHPIPYSRGGAVTYWKHIGLYVYRRALLLGYSTLRPGILEQNEKLEQLRALENGISIRVAETAYETIGVDTPEDLLQVESLITTASIPTTTHG